MLPGDTDGSLGILFNVSLIASFFGSFKFGVGAFTTGATFGEFFAFEIGSFAFENETVKMERKERKREKNVRRDQRGSREN